MKRGSFLLSIICFFSFVSSSYASEDLVKTQYSASPNKVYAIKDRPSITIANFNIAGGLRKHKVDLNLIAEAIKAMDADIVTLEEVDQNTTRSDGQDQAKVIAEKTGMYYAFGKATSMHNGNYGNADRKSVV